jgi:hypothetical protein
MLAPGVAALLPPRVPPGDAAEPVASGLRMLAPAIAAR